MKKKEKRGDHDAARYAALITDHESLQSANKVPAVAVVKRLLALILMNGCRDGH